MFGRKSVDSSVSFPTKSVDSSVLIPTKFVDSDISFQTKSVDSSVPFGPTSVDSSVPFGFKYVDSSVSFGPTSVDSSVSFASTYVDSSVLSAQSWVHLRHQTHQNHALALVLATFPTSGFGNQRFWHRILSISLTRLIRSMLSPESWSHFRAQIHENHALALVRALSPGPTFYIRLNRIQGLQTQRNP